MKEVINYSMLFILISIGERKCHCKSGPQPGRVINNEQVNRLWQLAISREIVGAPQVTTTVYFDSLSNRKTTINITTQHFELVIGTDNKGNPLPAKDSAIARRRISVLGNTSCTSACVANGPNTSCTISGCSFDGDDGCTPFQCSAGCTAQISCTRSSSARIWGVINL